MTNSFRAMIHKKYLFWHRTIINVFSCTLVNRNCRAMDVKEEVEEEVKEEVGEDAGEEAKHEVKEEVK